MMRLSVSLLFKFSCLIVGTVVASSNDTASTCETLASALPTDLFYPDTDTYNASIASYPFLQLRLHPTCIVRPQSPQDVATAINILRDTGCTKFAVRGGGHNANVGWNNIEDGVTIDLQSLKAVDVVDKVAKVGAGAIWQDVYDAVDPHGLAVLGGRIGVVGVAGFTTGGGISFFSPERGWACDGVINFEVVLANGEIVNANATSNPDLFAALKGGQSNFGIVTRFDLQAFEHGDLWGGRISFAPGTNTSDALLAAFTDFKNPANFDPYAAGWVTIRYNGTLKQYQPTSILWYTKPEQKPGALKNMTSVQPQAMNGMLEGSVADFARNASKVVKLAPLNTIWATTTFRISPTIIKKIHAAWQELIPKICEDHAYANPASELTFQSLAPAPKNGSAPNSLGFSADSTPEKDLVFLQIIFYYSDAQAYEDFNNALKDFIKKFDDLAKDEGVHNKFVYLNFAAWFQDPLAGYGKEELGKLRRVAKKYDPRGLFQTQLAGGFKVFGKGS